MADPHSGRPTSSVLALDRPKVVRGGSLALAFVDLGQAEKIRSAENFGEREFSERGYLRLRRMNYLGQTATCWSSTASMDAKSKAPKTA